LKGIVFDFDGTLATLNIDFRLMRQGVLEMISGYKIPGGLDGLKDLFVLEMIAAGALLISEHEPGRETEFTTKAHAYITRIEMDAAGRGSLIEGTRQMLQAMQARKIKTGVITRNCTAAVQAIFPDIHIFTHAVITRDHTLQVKPHPGHLLTMLQKLEVEAGHAAMVGDHPMDMKTGKEAGAFSVGVLTGHTGREDLERAGADLVLDSAADILAVVS
jgi:phosphoglycolate phosphatase